MTAAPQSYTSSGILTYSNRLHQISQLHLCKFSVDIYMIFIGGGVTHYQSPAKAGAGERQSERLIEEERRVSKPSTLEPPQGTS